MEVSSENDYLEFWKNVAENNPFFTVLVQSQAKDLAEQLSITNDTFSAMSPATTTEWIQNVLKYQSEMAQLWLGSLANTKEATPEPSRDPRFRGDAWNEGVFPFLRMSYEIAANTMVEMADKAGLPAHEQRKFSFYARVAADAMAPSNYPSTNPEVLKLAQETQGQSLVDGFQNVLRDLKKGYITTSDESAFEVGKNLATTPGSVVFRNELVELIQYKPMTDQVNSTPILIVPPCVNKFYIFDINEKKSMVRYLLEHGNSVYIVAWRNPGAELVDYGWDEYILKGIISAFEACSEVDKAEQIHMMSWCNGGTMQLAALSVFPDELNKKVASATFLSSMIDFSDPGGIEVFIDKPQFKVYKNRMKTAKVVPGRDIAQAMAMLHVNESIWNFVVNNYLMGKASRPFDILHWNADTSNLPVAWFSYYIQEMYVANKLMEAGALTLLGRPVDTRNIKVPCYFVAATDDHIVPWKTSYVATALVTGDTEFVLTDGGHVSGTVINHPVKSRRSFLTDGQNDQDADGWKETASKTDGSWWNHWLEWLGENSSDKTRTAPNKLGSKAYPPLADAPGTYVVEQVPQDGRLF
ncbi:MAG: alpha/beta fold hydrolase [Rhodobacteraceae bacterium]|nr:alpha/beta fold hydrolase [Paracoccaceae bacterium]